REFRGGGERRSDKRTERKNERCLRRERINCSTPFVEQKPGPQPAAADVPAQQRFGQRHTVGAARRNVDAEVTTVVAGWHQFNSKFKMQNSNTSQIFTLGEQPGARLIIASARLLFAF